MLVTFAESDFESGVGGGVGTGEIRSSEHPEAKSPIRVTATNGLTLRILGSP